MESTGIRPGLVGLYTGSGFNQKQDYKLETELGLDNIRVQELSWELVGNKLMWK